MSDEVPTPEPVTETTPVTEVKPLLSSKGLSPEDKAAKAIIIRAKLAEGVGLKTVCAELGVAWQSFLWCCPKEPRKKKNEEILVAPVGQRSLRDVIDELALTATTVIAVVKEVGPNGVEAYHHIVKGKEEDLHKLLGQITLRHMRALTEPPAMEIKK